MSDQTERDYDRLGKALSCTRARLVDPVGWIRDDGR